MTEVKPPASPQPSWFARAGLLVYVLLIVYASWYPFSGWHNNGLSPLAYLSAPFPYYWTMFDVVTNVIGYMPFGLLMVFALYPLLRRLPAVILAVVAGALLSGVMEAIQTYLPTRVPSKLDLMTNLAGTLFGAVSGVLLSHAFLEESHFLETRRRWFTHQTSGGGLIVLALWPLAQIYPQGYLFGHGQLTPILSEWLSAWLSRPIDLAAFLRHNVELTVEQYWLSEAIITACGLSGALLTLLCISRRHAPNARLVIALILVTIAAKSLATALLFAPENAFVWLTPGAQGGLLFGIAILSGLVFAPPVVQRRLAVLMLGISLFVVNAVPDNPYFVATLQTWVQGKFLNFNGAAQFLSLLWPFIAFWFLLHPVHRRNEK